MKINPEKLHRIIYEETRKALRNPMPRGAVCFSPDSIEREIIKSGRWLKYRLLVNGQAAGTVERALPSEGGVKVPGSRSGAWKIKVRGSQQSELLGSQEEAEKTLIERAVYFGIITFE